VRFGEETQERSQKMKSVEVRRKLTYWQQVFVQSKVNGASYDGEALPGQVWSWPKNTYRQRRLRGHQHVSENHVT
jgi:hypothetical protein